MCSRCKESKDPVEFSTNRARADGLATYCKPCTRAYNVKRRTKNPELHRANEAKWRSENSEKVRASTTKWYLANLDKAKDNAVKWARRYPEKARARSTKWRAANTEEMKACRDNWKRNNPGKVRAGLAKYRATKLQATPPWADLGAIEQFYINCPEGYHVDHIHPLQGKTICGLHVLENLQYLTASDNLSKSNKYEP